MLVSKPTHGGGAPLGIDLETGVATIRIPAKPAAEPEATAPTEPDQAEAAAPQESAPAD